MILHEYTYKINAAANSKGVAKRIACKLNQDDPFNYYVIIYSMSEGYLIEKYEIKGMK